MLSQHPNLITHLGRQVKFPIHKVKKCQQDKYLVESEAGKERHLSQKKLHINGGDKLVSPPLEASVRTP